MVVWLHGILCVAAGGEDPDERIVITASFTKGLKKGTRVTLVGFGTFYTAKRKARTGRNPQTGEAIQIKAKRVARFKPGKELETSVK